MPRLKVATSIIVALAIGACGEDPPPPRNPAPQALLKETNNVRHNVEWIRETAEGVEIGGWAFIDNQSAAGSEVFVVIKVADHESIFPAAKAQRHDVSVYFKNPNLDDSGFSALLKKGDIPRGEYRIGLYLKQGTQEALQYTSKSVTVN